MWLFRKHFHTKPHTFQRGSEPALYTLLWNWIQVKFQLSCDTSHGNMISYLIRTWCQIEHIPKRGCSSTLESFVALLHCIQINTVLFFLFQLRGETALCYKDDAVSGQPMLDRRFQSMHKQISAISWPCHCPNRRRGRKLRSAWSGMACQTIPFPYQHNHTPLQTHHQRMKRIRSQSPSHLSKHWFFTPLIHFSVLSPELA